MYNVLKLAHWLLTNLKVAYVRNPIRDKHDRF